MHLHYPCFLLSQPRYELLTDVAGFGEPEMRAGPMTSLLTMQRPHESGGKTIAKP
jgi:hypothetical protein